MKPLTPQHVRNLPHYLSARGWAPTACCHAGFDSWQCATARVLLPSPKSPDLKRRSPLILETIAVVEKSSAASVRQPLTTAVAA